MKKKTVVSDLHSLSSMIIIVTNFLCYFTDSFMSKKPKASSIVSGSGQIEVTSA